MMNKESDAREIAATAATTAASAAGKVAEVSTAVGLIGKDISYIQKDISEMKVDIKAMTGNFVSRTEWEDFKRGDYATTKRLVYGSITSIITAFVGAAFFFLTQR